jgi:hypothetical protein
MPTPGIIITPTLVPTPRPEFTVTSDVTSATITTPVGGITVHVDLNGSYTVSTRSPAWTFRGSVGYNLQHITVENGTDHLGAYQEIKFSYLAKVPRISSIRSYGSHPTVLFSTTYLQNSLNVEPFPVFTSYPKDLYHLSYHGSFGHYKFDLQGTDGPWLFFDKNDHGLILSPAANFMVAHMQVLDHGSISSGINSGIENLPQGFTHQTMLTVGHGINNTFDAWGRSMTGLQNKTLSANDANITLEKLGYWTDRGAAYYYNYIRPDGYTGTLQAMVDEFNQLGISLGYMQLDSWWYLKGTPPSWNNGSGGIYTYTPDPTLFPKGLGAFQKSINMPLMVHGRWIDPKSPYRTQYNISGNVSTDPRYWQSIMSYLHNNNVVVYEQDWLSAQAQSLSNLTDPNAWMTAMADAASQYNLTVQYCMPDPHHILQSTMYSSVVTARVSDDHFMRSHWDDFLYDSRPVSAVGVWPWTDVFTSSETDNLLISTLSAGMVGVGDALGTVDKTNLLQTVRPDGVIVKPDSSIVPLDSTYIAEAQGQNPAMVAAAYTYHTDMTAAYVFAYSRTGQDETASFSPASLGITSSKAYVYNYFTGKGELVSANQSVSRKVNDGSYYIVVPVGPSGIAFLGDAGKFASLGDKRISTLYDNGVLHATVAFAANEGAVTLHGYAPSQPVVTTTDGSAGTVSYNPKTHLFSFSLSAGKNNSATITISL